MANDLSIVDREGNSAEITSLSDVDVTTLNNLINVVNALSSSSGATRSVGEKFTSTLPTTDPSVHALDGSVLTKGIYSDFVDSIAELATEYPEYFCTEQGWQDAVTQNGYCDKYVYDSENQTVRLPKSNDNNTYVVIANTLKLPKQADVTNIVTDLNTKINKSYDNASSIPWHLLPTGLVVPWISKAPIPESYLVMNGQSVSKSSYSKLNIVINSDGLLDDPNDNTKLIIPDMTGRIWQGCSSYSDVLVAKEAGLPNITGEIQTDTSPFKLASGALQVDTNFKGAPPIPSSSSELFYWRFTLSAQRSSAIYGASTTVQPKARQALMIIKA